MISIAVISLTIVVGVDIVVWEGVVICLGSFDLFFYRSFGAPLAIGCR